MELEKLKGEYVEGWEQSGGRSENVWLQVPTKNLPFGYMKKCVSEGKLPCVWTCYDSAIYERDSSGKPIRVNKDLPKTISATFKPSFSKYSAIAENMGMKIAMALDMPTSYNYLVGFDQEEFPDIISNFKIKSNAQKVQDIGIVSVDFLQLAKLDTPVEEEVREKVDGKFEWVTRTRSFSGDELISFSESINIAKQQQNMSGTNFLIKNWIKSIDTLAEHYVPDFPKDKLQHQLEKINSRIVRSFLLREFLGDCDYTDLNSGFVINNEAQTLRYAPNFDYGESFNTLIKTKMDFLPSAKELQEILKWQKDFVEVKTKKAKETSVDVIAATYASDSSRENIRYVMKNYPKDVQEFMQNVDKALKSGVLDEIVDNYTKITKDGKPLLTKEEANMFKEYLHKRAEWFKTICDVMVPMS